jgi:hypothetical protein
MLSTQLKVEHRVIHNKKVGKRLDGCEDALLLVESILMICQHFSGHKVKQILAAFRSPLATHSDWRNEVAHGCKTPRYIQIYPA